MTSFLFCFIREVTPSWLDTLLLLLLLLLHDLYSANFEDRVGGTGVARWRT